MFLERFMDTVKRKKKWRRTEGMQEFGKRWTTNIKVYLDGRNTHDEAACGTLTTEMIRGRDGRNKVGREYWKDNNKSKTGSGYVATFPPKNDNVNTYPKVQDKGFIRPSHSVGDGVIVRRRMDLSVDLRSGYHQLCMHADDIPKTTFRMRYPNFEFTVMPFGSHPMHQRRSFMMNRVCKPYLDKFVIVFIDDILIYSKTKEEHEFHLKLVLELLRKEKLYVKFSKCEFWLHEVHFLGHVVNQSGIHMEPSKIEAVKN
ncbi:putative reverse transcriptase domain-containing protein [Tanacetum coccineum]